MKWLLLFLIALISISANAQEVYSIDGGVAILTTTIENSIVRIPGTEIRFGLGQHLNSNFYSHGSLSIVATDNGSWESYNAHVYCREQRCDPEPITYSVIGDLYYTGVACPIGLGYRVSNTFRGYLQHGPVLTGMCSLLSSSSSSLILVSHLGTRYQAITLRLAFN